MASKKSKLLDIGDGLVVGAPHVFTKLRTVSVASSGVTVAEVTLTDEELLSGEPEALKQVRRKLDPDGDVIAALEADIASNEPLNADSDHLVSDSAHLVSESNESEAE